MSLTIKYAAAVSDMVMDIHDTLVQAGFAVELVERVTIFDRPDISFHIDDTGTDRAELLHATETAIDGWSADQTDFEP